MVILQIDSDSIGAIPAKGDPPIPRHPDRPAGFALQRVPVEPRQVELLRRVATSSARSMRPTLATFGTLNPLGSPASKYRLNARLRKLRITSGNVMRQTANVKCRFTLLPDRNRERLRVRTGIMTAIGSVRVRPIS
jgi:hypothetical protein